MNLRQNKTEHDTLIGNLLEHWSFSGRLRRTSFLVKLAQEKRLLLNNSLISEDDIITFGNNIDSMITILNRKFEQNWDFHLDVVYRNDKTAFNLYVKIIYPQITISNSKNETHYIRNLIVVFPINPTYAGEFSICVGHLQGTRATLTQDEWYSGYRHSHLTSNKPHNYYDSLIPGNFCLGVNTEINDITDELLTDGYDETKFELYLYMIDTVVSWESIEGHPHFRINNIVPKAQNMLVPVNLSPTLIKDYYKKLSSPESMLSSMKYVYVNNKFIIKKDINLDSVVKSAILNSILSKDNIKRIIVKKNPNNNTSYVGYEDDITDSENMDSLFNNPDERNEKPYTIIQGKKINFSVLETTNVERPDINTYFIHPKFLNYVTDKLESKLYYKSVRRSILEREHQSSNA